MILSFQQEQKAEAPRAHEELQFSCVDAQSLFSGSGHFQPFEICGAGKSQFLKPTERRAKTAASVIQARNRHQ